MTPSELRERFEKLMYEGINISRKAQEGDAIYAGVEVIGKRITTRKDNGVVQEIFRRYQVWKSDLMDFLTETKRNTFEWHRFYEGNSVPSLIGGVEYGDVNSEKSQNLIRSVRMETSNKLELLKKVGDSIFKKGLPKGTFVNPDLFEMKTDRNIFAFNMVTGDARLNKVRADFKPGLQPFMILLALTSAENQSASYEILCPIVGAQTDKSGREKLYGVVKIIKKSLGILPTKDGKNRHSDIFVNTRVEGYRLRLK